MAVTKITYTGSTSIAISASSLGNGSGRESTAVDNSSNLFLDAHVRVTVNVGAVSGAPQCLVYAYGSEDGTVYPDMVTGTDAAIALESPTVLRLAGVIPTPTGSKPYESDVMSIGRLYGGALPKKWGIVIVNNTGASLAATTCSASYTGLTLTTT